MNYDDYCQSCGMPMGESKEMYGTNSDGSISNEYCKYCYENGKFTSDLSMNDMIDICVPHVLSANPTMKENEAKEMMKQFLPTLKRWM